MTRYKTTRPIVPPTADRQVIEARINNNITIQLRRYELTDIPHNYRLRTQAQVMKNTEKGLIDEDIETTQIWMNRSLPPNDKDTFNLAIWARENGKPWEHLGCLGCHRMSPVPHIGYMIREEWWGKSVATTAVRLFLQAWWALPRTEVELSTDDLDTYHLQLANLELHQGGSIDDSEVDNEADGKVVPEILLAEVEENNKGSLRVIEKCGFKLRRSGVIVHEKLGNFTLLDYILTRPQ